MRASCTGSQRGRIPSPAGFDGESQMLTWIFFFFVAFGAKVVLAFAMIYLIFPADRVCSDCDGETLPIRMGVAGRYILTPAVFEPVPVGDGQNRDDRDGEEDAGHARQFVSGEDGEPNVDRIECARLLNHKTDTERHDDLRNDRDVERASRIARPL